MPVRDHSSGVGDKIVEGMGPMGLPSGDMSALIFRQIVGENLKDEYSSFHRTPETPLIDDCSAAVLS